jgi:signal peptidase I
VSEPTEDEAGAATTATGEGAPKVPRRPAKAPSFGAAGAKTGAAEPMVQRSARQVRAAARILHKEARRILKRHAGRIAAEPAAEMRAAVAEIERLREHEDLQALQLLAERLDELLEQHASFARKSALRETLENIGIAVLIALGLRSCLYEPFKIPSGSMMPTLLTGDHIFVNKFVYGIQIPFTTTVVGESLGHIERGDVIVFRFPVDESQDFIKRVVGLPGDEVKVEGRQVSIKRAGQDEFEVLPRQRLEQRCFDPDDDRPIANCTLYEETLDGKTYVVRYRINTEERTDPLGPAQVWKVPEGHLMVMGDNRNDSLDSRRWTVPVEAVKAEGLLSTKDLRDLTDERLFSTDEPAYFDEQADPSHDHVIFMASHRAKGHDVALEVWREPSLGAAAVRRAKEVALAGQRVTVRAQGWDALVGPGQGAEAPAELDALRRHGEGIEALAVGEDPDTRHAIAQLREPAAVIALACGKVVCPDDASLARQLGAVLERLEANRGREARELLVRPDGPTNYSSLFKTRHNPRDHYYERRFASAEVAGPRGQVRLAAFRQPDEGTPLVRDAALFAVGVDRRAGGAEGAPGPEPGPKPEVDERGIETWVVEQRDAWVGIAADPAREMVVVLECGKEVCNRQAKARELLDMVAERMPKAAGDRRRLPTLLGVADVGGLPEVPSVRAELAEYDRVQLEATIKGESHSLELEAWLRPPEGLPGKLEALRAEQGDLEPDEAALPGAYAKADEHAVTFVFPVPETQAVLRLRCNKGLCPTRQTAVALAQRAAGKALDPANFIDPKAERPLPFVPRGNVKGRAERIWLPLSRFWLPVR